MSTLNLTDLPETLRQAYEDGSYHSNLDINHHSIWKIYGPDGEFEAPRFLSIVEGTFINALAYAVTLNNFQEFGEEYGHLEEYDIPNIVKVNDSHFENIKNKDELKAKNKLKKEKEELEKRLSEINRKLQS